MSLDFDWVDGGGGSSGQTIQYNVMPTPAVSGKIIQYVGETGANYTQGYFYQGVGGGTGSATWQQINVQPAPEIATQETVGGNTELSADNGVLVVETPDGSEDKQVANVEYVNNIVGDIETALSQI